jgi:FlaA1/EpsC-like NDP-sugar epimerase
MSVDGMCWAAATAGRLIAKHDVTEVLIAIPSAAGRQMARILELCRTADVRCKTVPGVAEIISGSASPAQVRDVAVEDLLGRSVVQLDIDDIRDRLEGQVVMITGAAGSIGSELCRQVARANPRAIVALEAGETPLFHIAQEMHERFPDVRFHAEIGTSSTAAASLKSSLLTGHPWSITPRHTSMCLMESNILKRWRTMSWAPSLWPPRRRIWCRDVCHDFLDKAVSPTNVMGVTKRVAEP